MFGNTRELGQATGQSESFASAAELKVVQDALNDQQQGLKAISDSIGEIKQEMSHIRESTQTLKQVSGWTLSGLSC